MKKRKIYNPVTGKYYEMKKSTGRKPKNIKGLWSNNEFKDTSSNKKTINKKSKGSRIELEFAKMLEEKGFIVWKPCKCKRGSKSSITSNDILGLFDIIAVGSTKEDIGVKLFLFQVKSNKSDFYKARKEVKRFIGKITENHLYVSFLVFVVLKDKKRWKLTEIFFNSTLDKILSATYYIIKTKNSVEGDFFKYYGGVSDR